MLRINLTPWMLALFVYSLSAQSSTSPTKKEHQPIRIITNNWASQKVISHIVGNIYQQLGFNVSYVELPTEGQWYALKYNKADIQVEVWEGSMADKYYQLKKENSIIDAGRYNATTREEWWFPSYVKEQCPNLPNWTALNECAALFSDENSNRGIYYAGPWEKPDRARIRALKLNFKLISLNSADELWDKLTEAYALKKPILLFNWTPNWVNTKYQGEFIEFPDYDAECETVPEWGINKTFLYDCGNPKSAWLKKVTSRSLAARNPCALNILKNVNLNNSQFEEIAALAMIKGLTIENAAKRWLSENQSLWSNWISKECR
tara:strand:+ start:193 stop:1152 length:960 start_codon:yes stop_codon:yes gene_type:complete